MPSLKCQALLQAQEAQQWPVEQEPGAALTTPSDGRGRLMQERAGGAQRQQSRADYGEGEARQGCDGGLMQAGH